MEPHDISFLFAPDHDAWRGRVEGRTIDFADDVRPQPAFHVPVDHKRGCGDHTVLTDFQIGDGLLEILLREPIRRARRHRRIKSGATPRHNSPLLEARSSWNSSYKKVDGPPASGSWFP